MRYKGSLHLHTTNSDGQLTPDEICRQYKDKDYDFIAMTDHNVFTEIDKEFKKDFLVIERSIEFHLPGSYLHIVGIGLDKADLEFGNSNQEIIDYILKNNGIAVVAHPNWQWGTKFSELIELKNYHGIEIFNTAIKEPPVKPYTGSPFSTEKWDYLLSHGRKISGFAVDDLHLVKDHLIFGGWIMVDSEELSKEAIISSIKKGDFYCSTGVILNKFHKDGDSYYIDSENGEEVVFIGEEGKILKVADGKKASIKIKGKYKYLRCEVRSKQGIAYTQPIYFNC